MAWLTPPPLVPKEDLRTVLPPGVKPERLRRLVLKSAFTGAVLGFVVGLVPVVIFYASLEGYRILLVGCTTFIGGIGAFYLGLRAVRAALIYGALLNSNRPTV
jgi:hypothetical protein